MRFIDLFAWIWWIKIWFENAGFICVFSNDFDKYSERTFNSNFFHQPLVFWDIQNIETKNIPDFDILCWWFPCQPFSIAWYRQWFNDENGRWNLFFDITRILRDKKPKAFLLENVKNLKTHDHWKTIKVIYEELEKLWYKVTDKVMNTMEYWNLPQNRERIYIVWFLDEDVFNNFVFPDPIILNKTINDCLEKDIVDKKYYYNWSKLFDKIKNEVNEYNTIYQWRRKYVRKNKSGVCPTLTANMGTWWHNVPIILDNQWIRKLTPRECANFQWFPNSYILPTIADSQLYKQFGNSVSIPVIQRIAEKMNLAFW